MLIDTHCHLYFDAFDTDRGEVLRRMAEAGVAGAVVVGIDAASCQQARDLARYYPQLRFSAGLHPTSPFPPHFDTNDYLTTYLLDEPRPVAIGECGIDLHWDTNPLARQRQVFQAQLEFAADCNLPAIIHTREADAETARVIAAVPDARCILHCFNGSPQLLELAQARGFYISFAGNLTYPKAQELHRAALQVPLEQLLVETDAPFMAPQEHRGRRNEPALCVHTARYLAQLRDLPEPRMQEILYANSLRCFNTKW